MEVGCGYLVNPGCRFTGRCALNTARSLRHIACCVAFGLAVAGPVYGDCKIERSELPVSVEHNRAYLNGEINGQRVRILVDTGSAVDLIWRSQAERLGLKLRELQGIQLAGVGGNVRTEQTTVKQLTIDNLTVKDVDFIVAGASKRPSGNVAMILGENFFSRFTTEFDLGHGAIRIMRVSGCRTEQLVYWSKTYSLAKLIRSPSDRNHIETEVLLNGEKILAWLDSGAYTSLVTTAAAARVKVTPDTTGVVAAGNARGIGRFAAPSWVGTFDTFALGDEQIHNAKLLIADVFAHNTSISLGSRIPVAMEGLPSMLIGADFFLSHRILVPQGGREFVFTYVGGPVFQTVHEEPTPEDSAAPDSSQVPIGPSPL